MTASAYDLGNALLARRPLPVDEATSVAEAAVADAQAADRVLPSEVPGVSDRQWTDFVFAMKSGDVGTVSASNDFGMFGMKPKRLADLGLLKDLKCTRSPTRRMVWVGEFVAPMTQKKFLRDAKAQYEAFAKSMREYAGRLLVGGGLPEGLSLSGALAVLHRCGPSGLNTWGDAERRFPDTVALVERTNGIF